MYISIHRKRRNKVIYIRLREMEATQKGIQAFREILHILDEISLITHQHEIDQIRDDTSESISWESKPPATANEKAPSSCSEFTHKRKENQSSMNTLDKLGVSPSGMNTFILRGQQFKIIAMSSRAACWT